MYEVWGIFGKCACVIPVLNLHFSLNVVHVRGKRGRQVPVLFDADEEKALTALTDLRQKIGVIDENIYIFAAPTRGSKGHLRGNDCMRKVINDVDGLEFPERIQSTPLRKYCATVSQIADLDETNLRWLADHLGHDLSVHREYYRLRDSTIELTKVSRLLLAMDEGNKGLVGKKLSDIELQGNTSKLINDQKL